MFLPHALNLCFDMGSYQKCVVNSLFNPYSHEVRTIVCGITCYTANNFLFLEAWLESDLHKYGFEFGGLTHFHGKRIANYVSLPS